MELQEAEEKLYRLEERKRLFEERLEEVETRLQELERSIEEEEEVLSLAQETSEYLRRKVSERFSDFVTEALQYVFGPNLSFKAEIKISRGLPAVKFYLNVNGLDVDPLDAQGGGVVDVLSLLLRIVSLEFKCKESPLLLDEPFKHLSSDYVPKAVNFLEQYSKQNGRQIVLVSHKDVRSGKVFRLRGRGGDVEVEAIWEE